MFELEVSQSPAILDSEFIALVLVKDRHIVWANQAAHHVFAAAPGALLGLATRELFLDEASYLSFGRGVAEAVAAGQIWRCELPQRRRDGSVGWFAFNVSRLAGDAETVVGAIVDISEKKAAELALEASEARYRAVVEDQTEVICRFLPDGTIRFVNEVFCRMFGQVSEDLIGHRWHPIAHPDDVARVDSRLREMSAANPVVTIENRVFVAGGQLRWMQFVNRGLFDAGGTLMEIQAVGRDITRLKEVEAGLRESQEQLELALSSSGLASWSFDFPTGQLKGDSRITGLLGLHPEILGDAAQWRQQVDPRDLARVERVVATHLRGDSESIQCEYRLRHREGHWVTVEMRGRVVRRDAAGAPLRMVGTLLDVSPRKRLNDEGLDLLKRIESLIREATHGSPAEPEAGKALERLTKRERQVLGMIADGLTSARIGAELHVSPNTVSNHRQNLMAKLGLHNRAELTRFALDQGLTKR